VRRSSPSNDTQQRHRRTSKGQQEQLQIQQQQQFYQQRTLTLTQMKDNYEQAGKKRERKQYICSPIFLISAWSFFFCFTTINIKNIIKQFDDETDEKIKE
jgi:hypothetical protein